MISHPKILYLFSAPLVAPDGSPLDALDIKAERDAIVRELAACRKEVSLRLGYATIDELARSIGEDFNILYVSSHGHEEFLLFEDGKGGSQPVTGDYLRRLICMGGFELAVVTACYSEKIGEMLVEAGIRHVIAVQCDVHVLDEAAVVFIGQFFRSLFQGDSVQKAFEMAKLLVEGNPDVMRIESHLRFISHEKGIPFVPEEKKFVLLPEDPTAHADPLLSEEVPPGALALDEPVLSKATLPVRPQSFTGRSVEMYDIINELITSRLVTITGVGGIGKTMLAIEVARWFCTRMYFADVFYLDLRQIETAGGIIDLLGAALGVRPAELDDVIAHLQERQCLLVLDNAEDMLWRDEDAMQNLINSIIKFTSNTTFLITSQRPVGGNLHEAEHIYRIYPLEQDDASLLFLMTAKRRMYEYEWKSDTFYSVLEQLGGHPLSIVLTACQLVPGVALEDVMKRIELYKAKAIKVKDITDRDVEHGENLVASLASAYDNVSGSARTLFGVLSMLPAGAQEEMLAGIFGNGAWECVHELNEASLVEIRDRRATLLPPVRLFAMNFCSEEIRKYYGPKIVEVLGSYIKKSYEGHRTKDAKIYHLSFTIDEPNLRSAVDLPCTPPQTPRVHSALGLLGPRLIFLYIYHNRWKEARNVGSRILTNLEKLQDQLGEADSLLILGILAMKLGDLDEARSRYDAALKMYQAADYDRGEANTLWELGDLTTLLGDLEKARSIYDEALRIYRSIDEKLGEANTLMHLGSLITLLGDLEEARSRYDEALRIYRSIDEKLGEANTLMYLGDLALQTDNLEEARSRYDGAMKIYRHFDYKLGEANILTRLGQWAGLQDSLDHAETYLDDAFRLFRETGSLEGQAEAHMVRAFLFLKHNNLTKAKHELDRCSSIQNEVCAHSKVVQWLIFHAVHLRLSGSKEGAKLCLEYAEEFASRTKSQHLLHQVEQQRRP
jgi:tetratricopeptide (TPR) repeat protein